MSDITPPTTTSNIPTTWNQVDEFNVILTAVDYADTELDTPSGVASTHYTTDGSEPEITSPSGTEFTVSGQGIFTIQYFSIDNNGNHEIFKTDELKLDNTPPISSVTPSFSPDGDDNWYITNPSITISATDNASGVDKIYYRWDTDTFQEYTVPLSIPSEGIHSLQFFAQDVAGNVEDVNTESFKFDDEEPFTQADIPSGLQKQETTITFFSSDNASGVINTFYTTDGTTPDTGSDSGSSVTLSETGVYQIKYFSVDFAGNQESVKEGAVELFIDIEAPQTYISESFPINGTNGWYRSSPEITLQSTDPSGIKEIKYKLYPTGADTTAKYTGTVDLSASIDLTSVNNIKLEVDQSGDLFEIDLKGAVPSQTTITEIINAINNAVGEDIATETDESGAEGTGYITLTSPTAGTGVETSEIKFLQPSSNDATNEVFGLDESSYPHTFTEQVVFVTYINPFTLPEDGLWTVEYYAVDNQDNKGEIGSKQYKLDSVQPETTTQVSIDPDGGNDWYITNPDITISATDELSGIYKTFYRWDDGVLLEYIGQTLNIPNEGINILNIYSIDNAGNIESLKQETFKLDQTAPITTDNTLDFQGIIFTSRVFGYQSVTGEASSVVSSETARLQNEGVVAVSRFYNVTKDQKYYVINIEGSNHDIVRALPLMENENSTRISSYKIGLLQVTPTNLTNLRDFSHVLTIHNFTKDVYYEIDGIQSDIESFSAYGKGALETGELVLSGEQPIDPGDVLRVTYAFEGVPLALADILEIDYQYDLSHEQHVLNTQEHTFVEPIDPPKIHDHDVTITLFPSDNASGATQTFYTTDGSTPTTSSSQGTEILLTENGTYTIKYFSVDAAGNQESVKEAEYQIIIDKNLPQVDLSFIPDPFEDGENGWFKNNFQLKVDVSTDDLVTRSGENSADVTEYKIISNENNKIDFNEGGPELTAILDTIDIDTSTNKIDFEESTGVQLTATLTTGSYTPDTLATEIQTQLNTIGSSVYTVTYTSDKFVFSSDLSGGGNVFNLLWSSGSNSTNSPRIILGFDDENKTGSSLYESDNEVIPEKIYDKSGIASHIESKLNSVGGLTYTISVVNDNPSSVGHQFDFSASGTFSLLWNSGTNSLESVGNTIAFDITSDDTGSSSYVSDYFRIKTDNYFVKTVTNVYNFTTFEDLTLISIEKGSSGFFDELIVDGNIPASGQEIRVDYQHYSGIDRVEFSLDNNLIFPVSIPVWNDLDKFVDLSNDRANFQIIFPATDGQFYLVDGEHTIYARGIDHNSVTGTGIPEKTGNVVSEPFKLDREDPTTTDDVVFDPNYQQGPVTVTLTYTDPIPGSGVSATHFTVDGSPVTRLSPKIQDFPDEKIVLEQSGVYATQYFSVDEAGNSEIVRTAPTIFVDATAPETSLLTSPLTPDGNNDWFISQPLITLTAIEEHSGLDKTYYKFVNDVAFVEYTGPFLLTQEGQIEIFFYSVDLVGNVEEVKSDIVKYDSTAPVTSTNIPASGYTSDPEVVFTIDDPASGGATTYFTIDGSTPDFTSTSGSSVTFNSSGTYTVKYFSIDNAGNVESVKTETLNLDLEDPVISDFTPSGAIITESTTEITFKVSDALSGVDIDTVKLFVDNIEYSTEKNSSYFSYVGTPAEYTVTISPIQGVLNFDDITLLQIKNVQDFAGNVAPTYEINFVPEDTTPPRLREVYPTPNSQDVSINSNVVAFIDDEQSGVDIKSVKITINETEFSIVTDPILKVQYIGAEEVVTITIRNNRLQTRINGLLDINISFLDENYNTVKKVNDYLDGLTDYISSVIDDRFDQQPSVDILNVNELDMTVDPILDLYLTDKNPNFAFLERGFGYLVFATPSFSLEHQVPVDVSIIASDQSGNEMETFSYIFIPHRTARLSVWKRNFLHTEALNYINDIQENIASNYTRSRSTNFYGHHKSIGLELAMIKEELDHLQEDGLFTTVRDRYLYQKFGYLLQTTPPAGFSHDDYRRLLLALLQIFFQGSTKESLEQGASLFTDSEVTIHEAVFIESLDISHQFTFFVDVFLGESRLLGIDLQTINGNLANLFQLVKPAHTFASIRFIFTDQFFFQLGCELIWEVDEFGNYVLDQFGNKIPVLDSSGFQQATRNHHTAICDRHKYSLSTIYNDDVRTDCSDVESEIRTIVEDVSLQFNGTEDTFTTVFSPIMKSNQPPRLAEASDVSVTVNGSPVNILEINAETGLIKIDVTPAYEDTVVVTYFHNPNFIYRHITFYLNDYDVVGNDFDTSSKSIFNTFNVNDYIGGYELSNILHAHVCETDLRFEIDNQIGDEYEFPDCTKNTTNIFHLNDYTVDGNDFDLENGSYLNDLDTVSKSYTCPYIFFDIEDQRTELVPLPEDSLANIEFGDDGSYNETLPTPEGSLESLTLDKFSEEIIIPSIRRTYDNVFVLNNILHTLNDPIDSLLIGELIEPVDFDRLLEMEMTFHETEWNREDNVPEISLHSGTDFNEEYAGATDSGTGQLIGKEFKVSPSSPTLSMGILNSIDYTLNEPITINYIF